MSWKAQIAAANLPQPMAELISRVIKQTRLWQSEKAAVADELIAHFADGLAAGTDSDQLIKSFGDERMAAKLIRRAKRRGRPWLWHTWSFSLRVLGVVLAIYAVFLLRFCLSKPTISVNYITKLNAPIIAIPESDRAWPLWRKAILACSDGPGSGKTGGDLLISDDILGSQQNPDPYWATRVKWLDAHAAGIEIARRAGTKPAMGFVLGPDGSAIDPELAWSLHGQTPGEPLYSVLLPHLSHLRSMAICLCFDAELAAQRGDPNRVEADLMSALAIRRQLQYAESFIITDLVGIAISDLALKRLEYILVRYPALLKDEQLIRLAHVLSGPRVAADLIAVQSERNAFADILQRVYTDDGHGDGHMTLSGERFLTVLTEMNRSADHIAQVQQLAETATVPLIGASRAEVAAEYGQVLDAIEANLHQPLRDVDSRAAESKVRELDASPMHKLRFNLVRLMVPGLSRAQVTCERYLGRRDGVVVGIALELYRRQHGQYPAALAELTPGILPEIPADRITGDPVKFKLIDGKAVIYSVGADRVDDGGTAPTVKSNGHVTQYTGAEWEVKPSDAPKGDWILFGPGIAGADDN